MQYTPLIGLQKPAGDEPFSRSILNSNSDKLDKQAVALGLMAAYYGSLTKGPLIKDTQGKPQSQTVAGPNGLAGVIIWSFGTTQITETLSITAPVTFSITKTVNLTDLSESWVVS